ncbi:hypothetical protein F2P81_018923 [Scophthalmus maximus]|uniref:Uncharacterized protein n=1 Tax=Scophthalmus maximus TaxID=52904 RepID=A0A6A4SBZ1_SCOMX|nr:hypothetical protein F2P81_018923 [Scophthalmus maximus]
MSTTSGFQRDLHHIQKVLSSQGTSKWPITRRGWNHCYMGELRLEDGYETVNLQQCVSVSRGFNKPRTNETQLHFHEETRFDPDVSRTKRVKKKKKKKRTKKTEREEV